MHVHSSICMSGRHVHLPLSQMEHARACLLFVQVGMCAHTGSPLPWPFPNGSRSRGGLQPGIGVRIRQRLLRSIIPAISILVYLIRSDVLCILDPCK